MYGRIRLNYLCFIKQKTNDKMKPTIIILAALFTFHTSLLFAGNEVSSPNAVTETAVLNISSLVPSTPAEATFEDVLLYTPDASSFAPSLPVEADFSDSPEMISAGTLAPSTPAVADFE
jgi:hypothetical protein